MPINQKKQKNINNNSPRPILTRIKFIMLKNKKEKTNRKEYMKTNKKILFTFGEKGLWFINKINKKIKSYNIKVPDNVNGNQFEGLILTAYNEQGTGNNTWWNGIFSFYEQEKAISSALRNKQEIVILSENIYGFYSVFICNLLNFAKKKNKKVTLITSFNAKNDINFLEYLSGKIEVINIMDSDKYKNSFLSSIGLYGLINCINSIYVEKIQECFETPPLNITEKTA